jgi:ribosomal protein S16
MASVKTITHIHNFNIPLTDNRGKQDGRYACRCGLVKPEPAPEPVNTTLKDYSDESWRINNAQI